MKLLYLLFVFVPLFSEAQHVYFGERSQQGTSFSIHFDKDGFPYPDYVIADSSMEKAYGSLFTWFQQNNEDFMEICRNYDYFPESIDKKTIYTLRAAIIQRWADSINKRSEQFSAIAFYIHGFRKSYHQQGNDVTSVTEFGMLRNELSNYGNPLPFAIDVYWDGTYDCCFSSNFKKNKVLFNLFADAVEQAKKTGYSMRLLTARLYNKPLQIVAHSLGAQITVSLLFNDTSVPANLPETPYQEHISVCLIAPAIGAQQFHSYYNRSHENYTDTTDAYRLMIVYNEADFVLQKKDPKTGFFGPGVHRYGETGLGCNHRHSAEKLKNYFSEHFPGSTIQLIDKTSMGKCHSLRCYTNSGHLKEVSDFLWGKGD